MALSKPSDQIAINDRGEEVMWQRKESPIARGFLAVDLHLSEERGGEWLDRVHRMRLHLDR